MSILPGNVRSLNDEEHGCECEGHSNDPCPNKAEIKMAGEVDSMGVEWVYLCQPCLKIFKALPPTEDECDHCHKTAILSPWRDIEEGNNGPVYHLCIECKQIQNQRLKEAWLDDDPEDDTPYIDHDDDDYDLPGFDD